MGEGIFWCSRCTTTIYGTGLYNCPECDEKVSYLTTDARPVFARERRILQFYGYGPLNTDVVWKSSKSRYYYINGHSVALPNSGQLRRDLPVMAAYIRDGNGLTINLSDLFIHKVQRRLLAGNEKGQQQ